MWFIKAGILPQFGVSYLTPRQIGMAQIKGQFTYLQLEISKLSLNLPGRKALLQANQLLCAVTSTYIVSFWPGRRILFLSMPFQRAIWSMPTRNLRAIRYSESPLRTV